MSRIILDFGSGNTCRNDWTYAKRMIDELKAVDTGKHEVIIKWQLFRKAGENIPLDQDIFSDAYAYASHIEYQTTASVFDEKSLDFLLKYDVPFVKIANNRSLDWLIGEVPRKVPIIVSVGEKDALNQCINLETLSIDHDNILYCISKYPSKREDYEEAFSHLHLRRGISDHTINFELFQRFKPKIVEWHYKLSDSTGLDAGPFARTPEMLKEIL